MMDIQIGVLALQGDFEKHLIVCRKLGVKGTTVKTAAELHTCDGLILPGGETTTFVNLLHKHRLWNDLIAFAQHKPVFGTCAGLIVLSRAVVHNQVQTMNVIDIEVERNAYGRQIDSFIDIIRVRLGDVHFDFEGVFIRAPKILKIGSDVRAVGWHHDDVVMAEKDNILVSTFHPELTDDPAIHEYFIGKINSK